MNSRAKGILDQATTVQRRYVLELLLEGSPSAACKKIGIHRTTPYKWDNLPELDEAVDLILMDNIEAAQMALEGLIMEAIRALRGGLRHRSTAIGAANSILDRAGVVRQSAVDVTSGGESLPSPAITEIVVKLPEDDESVDDQ